METIQSLLTESQKEMMKPIYDKKTGLHPGMNIAGCFQPLVIRYNFTSPAMRNVSGEIIRKNGKIVRESSIAKAHRADYKQKCKNEYGDQWKRVFFHGKSPNLN